MWPRISILAPINEVNDSHHGLPLTKSINSLDHAINIHLLKFVSSRLMCKKNCYQLIEKISFSFPFFLIIFSTLKNK